MNNRVYRLVFSALLAAIYAAVTLSTGFMSYHSLQFRVAEALCILPALLPFSTWGLFIGCVLANIFSPIGVADMVFGSLASLCACLCAARIGRGGLSMGRSIAVCLMPVVWNAVVVGLLLAFAGTNAGDSAPFWLLFAGNALSVAFGEAVVMFILGLPLLRWLQRGDKLARFGIGT